MPLPATSTSQSVTVTQTGGSAIQVAEPPVISSVSPGTASAGQVVTVSGADFGASQGSGHLTFSDDGTNWGAPGDEATFTVDSWTGNSITFTVPSPSGPGGEWSVTPGSTATVAVTNANGQTSNTGTVTIASS